MDDKKAKAHMMSRWLLIGFILGTCVILIMLFMLFVNFGNILHFSMGCNGTDAFYTGQGLFEDSESMFDMINGKAGMPGMSPAVMLEKGEADCDSFSNAIMCLAKKYNETCKFYFSLSFDDSIGDFGGKFDNGHLGIKCWNREEKYWEVFY